MDQLLEKLAISKAIMDKHNQIKRGNATEPTVNISTPELQQFDAPVGNYNIPQEFLSEGMITQSPTRNSNQTVTSDSIMKSKSQSHSNLSFLCKFFNLIIDFGS